MYCEWKTSVWTNFLHVQFKFLAETCCTVNNVFLNPILLWTASDWGRRRQLLTLAEGRCEKIIQEIVLTSFAFCLPKYNNLWTHKGEEPWSLGEKHVYDTFHLFPTLDFPTWVAFDGIVTLRTHLPRSYND